MMSRSSEVREFFTTMVMVLVEFLSLQDMHITRYLHLSAALDHSRTSSTLASSDQDTWDCSLLWSCSSTATKFRCMQTNSLKKMDSAHRQSTATIQLLPKSQVDIGSLTDMNTTSTTKQNESTKKPACSRSTTTRTSFNINYTMVFAS